MKTWMLVVAGGALGACVSPEPGADGGVDAGTAADYPLWGWATGLAGLYGSGDEGASWVRVSENPSRAIGGATFGGTTVLVSKQGEVSRTQDSGKTWTTASIVGLPGSGVWSVGASSTTLFVGAQGALFRSTDQGLTFSRAGTGLPPMANVDSIVAIGPTVLVSVSLSGLFRSTDDGQTFTAAVNGIDSGVFNNAIASSLAVSAGRVYAAFQGTGVFVSANEGQSWTLASTGLPASGVGRVFAAGGRVFAAPPTAGLFVSNDGMTWTATCGLPAQTSVLQLIASGNTLFLVTTRSFMQGFFVSKDLGVTCAPGGQPVGSSGLTDPLSFVFLR